MFDQAAAEETFQTIRADAVEGQRGPAAARSPAFIDVDPAIVRAWVIERFGYIQLLASDVAPATWMATNIRVPAGWVAQMDVYHGPRGKGWILRVRVTDGEDVWTRAQGVGPEERDVDWALAKPERSR